MSGDRVSGTCIHSLVTTTPALTHFSPRLYVALCLLCFFVCCAFQATLLLLACACEGRRTRVLKTWPCMPQTIPLLASAVCLGRGELTATSRWLALARIGIGIDDIARDTQPSSTMSNVRLINQTW